MIDEFKTVSVIAIRRAVRRELLAIVCAFVLCGILTAGLWPFHAPRNEVTWLKNRNGLRFGRYGGIQSSGTFNTLNPDEETAVSVEIWLQPRFIGDSNTVLAFYSHNSPKHFSLRQSHADLVVRSDIRNGPHRKAAAIYLADVFRKGTPVFISFASGAHGSAAYIDGALAATFPQFIVARGALTGRLVVGDSPVQSDNWQGRLYGLAIYGRDLTAAQVLRDYRTWTGTGRPDFSADERGVALYLFRERTGNVVHNSAGGIVDLYIPGRYTILNEKFLEPSWKEFRNDWGYWKNVFINITGFVPFGFFVCALFSIGWRINRPGLTTILLGASVSLSIEILQAFLPTRQSGMTDLITNTLGTVLGVAIYRLVAYFSSQRRLPMGN